MTRRAAFVDTLRSNGWDFLLVDAGDLVPRTGLDAQAELKVETLARAMREMQYDAVTLGDHDLAPGPEYAAKLVEWLGRPVLATHYSLGEGLSEPSRVLPLRDKQVGLLAFLDPALAAEHAPWLEVAPWSSARKEVRRLSKETDALVALVHAPDSAAVGRLIDLYPELDLVLVAHEAGLGTTPYRRGYTTVAGAPHRGRHLGRAEITLRPAGGTDTRAVYLKVVREWGRRPNVDALMAEYHLNMRSLVMSAEFENERLANLREPEIEFVGNEACASCHEPETEQWKSTLHAHAHETLVREKKDHDPECQTCHTTGYGIRTAFATPRSTPEFWNVGCESCHGAGAEHVSMPEAPYGKTDEALCLTCHTPDNSPDFDHAKYLPKVLHTAIAEPGDGH